ncbi:Protein of unknown function [Bacillus cereus]|nr:Protein of unknown function [Bacillus cereus]
MHQINEATVIFEITLL